jgi:tetratricopeptide (TPR) repeat protein
VVDLLLSLRDVKAHKAMIDLYERMPLPLKRAKMMREQLGFALNREGRFQEAEKALNEVIAEFGPSSETNALLGRIYKDRWDLAKKEGLPEARALLKNAIDAYLAGFEADRRDARAAWELETTARNLRLVREMREGRGEDTAWLKRLEDTLKERAQGREAAKAAG